MRTSAPAILLVIGLLPGIAFGIEVSGDVWGTWSPDNNPYEVVGELRVPPESTLVIEPGVYVNFKGHYKFIIDSLALLLAVGTETDSIIFTAEDPDSGWHGIRFLQADSSSQIGYCRLEHGKAVGDVHVDRNGGAIYCYYSSPAIRNSSLTHNCATYYGGGIYCYSSSPTISDNHISSDSAFYRGGGIHCSQSNPVISGNIIDGNYADEEGAGICCRDRSSPRIAGNTIAGNSSLYIGAGISSTLDSRPTIEGNTISENSTEGGGGGICCLNAGAAIRDNVVVGNSAWSGGGVFCDHADVTIENNTISGNLATGDYGGGGIFCYYSNPLIAGNTLSENSAYDYWSEYASGGGIYCGDSNPMVVSNTMSGNAARYAGGAVFCYSYSAPTMICNTISGNSADSFGGGIACYLSSDPTVTNTILWADTAPEGSEIYVENSSPTVRYSDVQGGWPGTGNIDADPMFAGPHNRNFHLRWHSPCINAGDPSLTDPDGTRSDIGALYFNQDVLGIVELYPHHTPILIPPEGGDLIYDGWVFNFRGHAGRADIWTYTFVPEVGRYGPLDLYENVRIPTDSLGKDHITQRVPGVAPQGDYVFVAYVGEYPSTIIDSSCFYFTKTGSATGGIADWESPKRWFDGGLASTGSSLPTCYALGQNCPNPFNATTIINYQLPVDAYIKLDVFNLFGQRLATLVDCTQECGNRSVIWDASGFASGIYFYRLTAGDYTSTSKMVLSK
jgi:parallel beta-helix repeat protein